MNDIGQLISNYKPTEETVKIVSTTNVVLFVGITGAGKNTLMSEILKRDEYSKIISHTTRSPRANGEIMEQDGVDYYFINNDMVTKMLINKEFVEAKFVHGNTVYGTSVAELRRINSEGKIATKDLDVQGVREYVSMSNKVLPIFILPPSYDVWLDRLIGRYESKDAFEQAWPSRRESAINELSEALDVEYYRFVINDDLLDAVRDVNDILTGGYSSNIESRQIAQDILDKLKALN